MNYSQTNIEYTTSYPYVLEGESNPQLGSSTGFNNTMELYPAVCNTHLDKQYELQSIGPLPELDCPNASNNTTIYSDLNPAPLSLLTNNDMTWGYTNSDNLQLNNTVNYNGSNIGYNKCIPQFKNSIEICTPRDCALGNVNTSYLYGFECNKMWNNNTKRRFINGREKKLKMF